MAYEGRFEDHDKLLKKTAWRVLRRASYINGIDVQDIEQELAIAWCKARDGYNGQSFDPPIPFIPYLMKMCWWHINRWIKEEFAEQAFAGVSLDDFVGSGDDQVALHEVARCDVEEKSSEDLCREAQIRDLMAKKLSERARQFVSLLENPPKGLVEQHQGLRTRFKEAKARGVTGFVPSTITAGIVFDLMGASRNERHKILTEVKAFSEKVCQ